MKKSRFFDSHTKGKPTVSHDKFKAASGVYFIRSIRTKEIVYVGSSAGNLYKTIYRHFQEWNDRSREKNFDRTTYSKTAYEIALIITASGPQALRIEKYFIRKLQPKGNPIKYGLLTFAEKQENAIEARYKNADFLPIEEIREADF